MDQNRQMPQILLVTSRDLPDGEPRGDLITAALAARGVDASWVAWDDPGVDWSGADVVAVRSTWDYHRRTAEFLAWARERRVADPAAQRLRRSSPGTPTSATSSTSSCRTSRPRRSTTPTASPAPIQQWGTVVVKPRVGASGIGVVVASGPDDAARLTGGPWVVQPLVESVRTVGETSVFVFGGRALLPGRQAARRRRGAGPRGVRRQLRRRAARPRAGRPRGAGGRLGG